MSYGANSFRDGAGNDYGVFKSFNPDLGDWFTIFKGNQPRNLSELTSPTSTVLIGEPAERGEVIPAGGSYPGNYRYVVGPIWATITSYFPSGRHNGGSNVIFADGHANWMHQEKLAHDLSYWRAKAGSPPDP